jgi:hypothetical protein
MHALVRVEAGSLSLQVSMLRAADGWVLVGASDLSLNRVPATGFWRLVHGDVISAGLVDVMYVDDEAAGGEVPAQVFEQVIAAGGTPASLAVASDSVLGLGRSAGWLGELEALQGRGLSVSRDWGFVREVELSLAEPMARAWPRRWLRLLGRVDTLRLTRRLRLVERGQLERHELELVVGDLCASLEGRLPLLEEFELSAGFDAVPAEVCHRLLRLCPRVVLVDGPADEPDVCDEGEEAVRLFPEPAPSSWAAEPESPGLPPRAR